MFPIYHLISILPGWLVSLFGVGFFVLQITLMLDCLRNQRDTYWLWILWVLPAIGALAYWFYFKYPGSRLEHALFRFGTNRKRIAELEVTAAHVGNAANFEELGDAWWKQGRLKDAEINYRAALAKDPTLRDSRARLGYCLVAANKPAEAWPLLESVIRENQEHDHEYLLHQSARCRRLMGDREGARKLYVAYLHRHSYFEPQVELAELCAELGDKEEAKRLCEEVIRDLKLSPPYARRKQGRFAGQAKKLLRRLAKPVS